jgi:hypothetical protein
MFTGNTGTYFDDTSYRLDMWYHLTMVLSDTTGKIYVNGTQTAQRTTMNPPTNTTKTNCYIGAGNVVIDELKFYNRALSEAEILSDAQTNGPVT